MMDFGRRVNTPRIAFRVAYRLLLVSLFCFACGIGAARCGAQSGLVAAANPRPLTTGTPIIYPGTYTGSMMVETKCCGLADGEMTLTVAANGAIIGSANNDDGTSVEVSGSISSSGAVSMTFTSPFPLPTPGTTPTFTCTGTFGWDDSPADYEFNGTCNDGEGDSGTWSVSTDFSAPSLTFLDANYKFSQVDLSDGNLSNIGSGQIAALTADTQVVEAAVADGVTKVLLEYVAPTNGTVDFEEVEGSAGDRLETLNGSTDTTEVPTQLVNGRNVAFALYVTPSSLPGIPNGTVNFAEFDAAFAPPGYPNDPYSADLGIELLDPPVVLIHGFASGPSTWVNGTGTGPLYSLLNAGYQVSKVDYSSTSMNSFASNQAVLLTNVGGIEQVLTKYRNSGCAITQVDVVAHSMGGILTRELSMMFTYKRLENFKTGFVRRLITIGTPHLGSKAANYIVNLASGPVGPLIISALKSAGWSYGGAFADLEYGSAAIQNINNDNPIPSFAFAGISSFPNSDNTLMAVYGALSVLTAITGGVTPSSVFPGEASDLIVGATSAQGGLPDGYAYKTLNSTDHLQEPPSSEIGSEVLTLESDPPAAFDAAGFPAPSTVPYPAADSVAPTAAPSVTPAATAFFTITSPTAGQVFQPGAAVTVTLTPVAGITLSSASITVGAPGQLIGSQLVAASPFTATFTIPTTFVGDLPINVLASDSAGEVCLVSSDCSVKTTATVSSLTVSAPDNAFSTLAATTQLDVVGLFSDGVTRDITDASTGTIYKSSDDNVVSVGAGGLVSVVGNGTAELTATNGSASASVAFTVSIDVPDVLLVSPATGAVGASVPLSVAGYSLTGATSVQLYVNDAPDPDITATNVAVDSAGSNLTCTLTIGPSAAPGLRTVVVTTPAGTSSPYAAPDAAGFTIESSSIPAAPTGLTATAGIAEVALTWTASVGATSYNVYRGTASGGESTTAVATGVTTTGFTNTGLTNGTTYYYKVAAVNTGGTSALSSEASATPKAAAPAAPTGLTATAGIAEITLSWTASVGATSYNVYRGTASGGESTTAVATGITTTGFTNTGLTNGTTCYYKVSAVNTGGTSALSSEASATPKTGIPPAPTSLTATAGSGEVTISWSTTAGATSYVIHWLAPSWTSYRLLTTTTGLSYIEKGLVNGDSYSFEVAAVGSGGSSPYSTPVTAVPVGTPTGVAAVSGNGEITISWKSSPGATSYNIIWDAPGWASYRSLTETTAISYTIKGVVNGDSYSFKVTALNSRGTSPTSAAVTATPLGTPSGLTAVAGNAQVSLSWTASAGASAYNVFRGTSTGGESTTPIKTEVTTATFTNTGLTNGVTYYYKVAAVNGGGTSALSVEVHATPTP